MNNGSTQRFAIDADENKIIIKAAAFLWPTHLSGTLTSIVQIELADCNILEKLNTNFL